MNLEQIAQAALNRDSLRLRELVQELLDTYPNLGEVPEPTFAQESKVILAGLLELLAERRKQLPPWWTQKVGGMLEPFFMLESTYTMPRLRDYCQRESPLPLRKRGLYAPPNFLEFA